MSRDAATDIIRHLREHGHVAYLAGGCVRDRLLGLEPQDHDVATDAPPEVVQKLFRRSQPVGEAFGVVLVYTHAPAPHADAERANAREASGPARRFVATEVATFRTEGVYSDGRHPDAVEFTTAEYDAQRRDFTINGLFEDPLHPEQPNPDSDDDGVIDYVGGRADLQAKVLRAIGDPDRRFGEDYLRMLRAVRFATRLSFTLDPATAAAIRNLAPSLGQISRERIGGEVRAMLTGPRPAQAATLLEELHLDGPTLNEDHQTSTGTALAKLIPGAGAEARFPGALAAWMIDRHGPGGADAAVVSRWRKALCLSNEETDTLSRVLRHAAAAEGWPAMGVAQRKRLLTATDWEPALHLLRALGRAETIEAESPMLRDDGVGLAPPPLLDGADLIAQGLKPGPRFKTLLDDAYDAQLEGQLVNRDQAVAWIATQTRGD